MRLPRRRRLSASWATGGRRVPPPEGSSLALTEATSRHRALTRAVLIGAATALVVVLAWSLLESRSLRVPLPFEDAAMLFRYAENLASGGGIAWNFGEDPGLTDGATDLGFVLVLAPLIWVGVSSVAAAVLVNLIAVAGIGALLGAASQALWRLPLGATLAIVAFVASGPVHRYVLSGFSPLMMGMLLLATFLAAVVGSGRAAYWQRWLILGGLLAGIAGWWRPEGFVLAPLFLISGILITSGGSLQFRVRSALTAAPPFLILAAAWVVFRVVYFGQLLPTSAVMKGGGITPGNALSTFQFVGTALLPALGLIIVVGLLNPRSSWLMAGTLLATSLVWVNGAIPHFWWDRLGIPAVPTASDWMTKIVIVPVLVVIAARSIRRHDRVWLVPALLVVASSFWVLFETTLNWWMRMQWPMVPVIGAAILTVVFPRARAGIVSSMRSGWQRAALFALFVVPVMLFHLPWSGYSEFPFHAAVSRALSGVDTSYVRLASTEAGLIPLAVQGPALDPWGHNNRRIAETGGAALSDELASFAPTMIVTHGRTPDSVASSSCADVPRGVAFGPFSAEWLSMVDVLHTYANSRGMTLIRSTETDACEAWSIYVSDDVGDDVRQALRSYQIDGIDLVSREAA